MQRAVENDAMRCAGAARELQSFADCICASWKTTPVKLIRLCLCGWIRRTFLCTRTLDRPASSVRCHFVQLVILASYQNGRDVHLRQCKIFGPRK